MSWEGEIKKQMDWNQNMTKQFNLQPAMQKKKEQ